MLARLVRKSDADGDSPGSSRSHSTNPSPVGTPARYPNGKQKNPSSSDIMLSRLVRESDADEDSPGSSRSHSTNPSPIGTPARYPNGKQKFTGSVWLSSPPKLVSQRSDPPVGESAHIGAKEPLPSSRTMTLPNGTQPALLSAFKGTRESQHAQPTSNQSVANRATLAPRNGATTTQKTRVLSPLHEEDESALAHHHATVLRTPPDHLHEACEKANHAYEKLRLAAKPYQSLASLPASSASMAQPYSGTYQRTTSPASSTMAHDPAFVFPMSTPQPMTPAHRTNGLLAAFNSPSGQCSSARASRPDFQSPQGPSQFVTNTTYRPGNGVGASGAPKFNPHATTSHSTPTERAGSASLEHKASDVITESPLYGALDNDQYATESHPMMDVARMQLERQLQLRATELYAQQWMMAAEYQQHMMIPREDILDQMAQEFKVVRDERDQGLVRQKRLSDQVEQYKAEKRTLQMEIAKRDNPLMHTRQNVSATDRNLADRIQHLEAETEKLEDILAVYEHFRVEQEAKNQAWNIEKANLERALKIKDQKLANQKMELEKAKAEIAKIYAFQKYNEQRVEELEQTHRIIQLAAYNDIPLLQT